MIAKRYMTTDETREFASLRLAEPYVGAKSQYLYKFVDCSCDEQNQEQCACPTVAYGGFSLYAVFFAEIKNVIVLPDFRGHGYAQRIIPLLEEEITHRLILMTVRIENAAMRATMAKRGYTLLRTMKSRKGNTVEVYYKEIN